MRRTLLAKLGLVAVVLALALPPRPPRDRDCQPVPRPPRVTPDCADVTLPPNIAPLNFRVAELGTRRVVVRLSGGGRALRVAARGAVVRWPLGAWHELLRASRGGDLTVRVDARDAAGHWTRYAPFVEHVANEPIDSHLVYRWFRPTFTTVTPLGLYQRDLTSYAQTPILRSGAIGGKCVNCHDFLNRRPDTFCFHVRGPRMAGMVVVREGRAQLLDTRATEGQRPAGFATWQPTGEWIGFTRNKIRQYFHAAGPLARDALDADASLGLTCVVAGDTVDPAALNPPGQLPSTPCWSPDGRWLYFSSAPRLAAADPQSRVAGQPRQRFDLCRARFEPVGSRWGAPETVLRGADAGGLSIVQPRVSPDGRWVLVCLCDYGDFPINRLHADLALIDLRHTPARAVRLDPGPDSLRDTWHCWSGDSRWVVFTRKADNGLYGRPYLRYVDADGRAAKPFVLPQAEPDFYESCLYTYNLPELVSGPVTVGEDELAAAIDGARQRGDKGGGESYQ